MGYMGKALTFSVWSHNIDTYTLVEKWHFNYCLQVIFVKKRHQLRMAYLAVTCRALCEIGEILANTILDLGRRALNIAENVSKNGVEY